MPEVFTAPFSDPGAVSPWFVLMRLLVSAALGFLVAWVYRRATPSVGASESLPTTLVLLCILIAMVTQVIGDNVARAFSLVGALAIVRFRTVVRDTRDTAFVIFAVVVGMSVGAHNLWVAGIGIVITAAAAIFMAAGKTEAVRQPAYELRIKVAAGLNVEDLFLGPLRAFTQERKLLVLSTKQATSVEETYEIRLLNDRQAQDLVKALQLIEGVQDIRLERCNPEQD